MSTKFVLYVVIAVDEQRQAPGALVKQLDSLGRRVGGIEWYGGKGGVVVVPARLTSQFGKIEVTVAPGVQVGVVEDKACVLPDRRPVNVCRHLPNEVQER